MQSSTVPNVPSFFEFEPAFPPEVKTAIVEFLPHLVPLFPGWCQKCHFQFDYLPGESTAVLEIETNYNYRWVSVSVKPAFLNESVESRAQTLLHEVLHAFSSPLVSWVHGVFEEDFEKENPKYFRELSSRLEEKEEVWVQDFSHTLFPLVFPHLVERPVDSSMVIHPSDFPHGEPSEALRGAYKDGLLSNTSASNSVENSKDSVPSPGVPLIDILGSNSPEGIQAEPHSDEFLKNHGKGDVAEVRVTHPSTKRFVSEAESRDLDFQNVREY